MFYVLDADCYPAWLKPLTGIEAAEWVARGDAASYVPCDKWNLVFASRHGNPARWHCWPV